jgi:hypothetical protein
MPVGFVAGVGDLAAVDVGNGTGLDETPLKDFEAVAEDKQQVIILVVGTTCTTPRGCGPKCTKWVPERRKGVRSLMVEQYVFRRCLN